MTGVIAYAFARLRLRPGRALLSAGGIAVVSAMLGAAVTVAASLAGGFERAAERADLADVIARFDTAPGALVAERASSLPNVRSFARRYTAFGVELRAPEHHVFVARAEGIREGARGYAIVAGRDLSGKSDEALVERGLARTWHLRPGSTIVVGGFIPKRVVGVAVEPDTAWGSLSRRERRVAIDRMSSAKAALTASTATAVALWAGRARTRRIARSALEHAVAVSIDERRL